MAKTHGKDASVEVGTTLIAETIDWTLDENIDLADQTAQGDTAKTYLTGIADWTASVNCLIDQADTGGQGAFTLGAAATVHFFPEGQVSGDADWTGASIITAISTNAPIGDVVKISFSLQGNGALTKGTVI